jgi:hypothetical protein
MSSKKILCVAVSAIPPGYTEPIQVYYSEFDVTDNIEAENFVREKWCGTDKEIVSITTKWVEANECDDEEAEEEVVCDDCGERFDKDDVKEIHGKIVCDECSSEEETCDGEECDECSARQWADDSMRTRYGEV